ncbi:MAG TPA: biotin synthase [Aquabacterium sp.]|uniref:biotin synthase n=1 Tax=Aquabacterium sp. TaxID=1872578 RepID=UPI002E37A067|nr:biotin synthase [Aquabacterium sp.]HEX5355878.1 biotin synthase [Aquabacterium sp.]
MSAPAPCAPSERALLRQAERMAALGESPWLHQEVGRRLADKLAPIKLQPQSWIDWSAFLGGSGEQVRAAYPQAQRWVVEPTAALRQRSQEALAQHATRSWKTLWRKDAPKAWLAGELSDAPWQPDGVQMLWANMCLHAHADLAGMMRQWHRQLAVGGFLMCSGLGPDTARELRALYRSLGWDLPTIDFIDMHDLGDELVKAGFADPVMDMERLTLTWETPQAMLTELRTWGGNVASGRLAGLRTPRWQARLLDLLSQHLTRPDGRLGLTIEVVYGHAIKPEPRIKLEPETRVSLDDMRRMVRKQG